MVVTTLNPHKALLRPPLHYILKAHDHQNGKFMIEGKAISRFKFILPKVEGPRDKRKCKWMKNQH
jgi:hypothetical protein